MAKTLALESIQICGILLFISIFAYSEAGDCCRPKEIKFTVFIQDITAGPNATAFPVAGIPGRPRNLLEFGTVIVDDAPLTQGISITSPEIGRAQGIYVSSSRDGINTHFLFSFIFTKGLYRNSTLEFQGSGNQNAPKELSVVSGTRLFRFVRGFATMETVLPRPNYRVVKTDITIRRY